MLQVSCLFSIIPQIINPQISFTMPTLSSSPAVTYDFIATEDANKDKVMDVLVVLRQNEGSQNNTCSGAGMRCLLREQELDYLCLFNPAILCVFPGLPSPCVFVLAVDGTDGETLWERRLKPEFHWAQCGLDKDTSRTWDCLVSHSDQLSAVDKYTGLWNSVVCDSVRFSAQPQQHAVSWGQE